MPFYNLFHNKQSQTVPLLGSICITNHIMGRIVQPVNLLVGSSYTVIFNENPAGIVILIDGHINHAPLFIVVYAVLNKV